MPSTRIGGRQSLPITGVRYRSGVAPSGGFWNRAIASDRAGTVHNDHAGRRRCRPVHTGGCAMTDSFGEQDQDRGSGQDSGFGGDTGGYNDQQDGGNGGGFGGDDRDASGGGSYGGDSGTGGGGFGGDDRSSGAG